VVGSQSKLNELDALTTRANASREAAGYRQQGMNYKAEGDLAAASGANAQAQGQMGAASSILSGASSMSSTWAKMSPGSTTTSAAGWQKTTNVKWGTSSSVWNRGY
jgi:hypothetical protein